ncbi:hypothetical protein CEXT_28791 [Caerostris extrusa]|uniref:Uncharacterized protein n=1 Tax=Caerostris extrusa TaxID=172846 RepID=A0AAV4RT23_CAEEX|nr:hypothetical protein CEXT_28791 [Caerostris extrusa]
MGMRAGPISPASLDGAPVSFRQGAQIPAANKILIMDPLCPRGLPEGAEGRREAGCYFIHLLSLIERGEEFGNFHGFARPGFTVKKKEKKKKSFC